MPKSATATHCRENDEIEPWSDFIIFEIELTGTNVTKNRRRCANEYQMESETYLRTLRIITRYPVSLELLFWDCKHLVTFGYVPLNLLQDFRA